MLLLQPSLPLETHFTKESVHISTTTPQHLLAQQAQGHTAEKRHKTAAQRIASHHTRRAWKNKNTGGRPHATRRRHNDIQRRPRLTLAGDPPASDSRASAASRDRPIPGLRLRLRLFLCRPRLCLPSRSPSRWPSRSPLKRARSARLVDSSDSSRSFSRLAFSRAASLKTVRGREGGRARAGGSGVSVGDDGVQEGKKGGDFLNGSSAHHHQNQRQYRHQHQHQPRQQHCTEAAGALSAAATRRDTRHKTRDTDRARTCTLARAPPFWPPACAAPTSRIRSLRPWTEWRRSCTWLAARRFPASPPPAKPASATLPPYNVI